MDERNHGGCTTVIAVVSAKGGTGKSTIALNLAGALSKKNRKVLLIDADPQGSIAQWVECAHQGEPHILIEPSPRAIRDIRKLCKNYDIVIMDSPPTFRKRVRTIIRFSDRLIIPVTPGMTDFWSTRALVDIYLEEKEKRPNLDARLLISRSDRRTRYGRDFRSTLAKLNIPIFLTEIPQRVVYNEAWNAGKTVDTLEPAGVAAQEMKLLSDELALWMKSATER